jgi:hypothetical protein
MWLTAGTIVTGAGFLPAATNGTITWATALYGDLGGTASAPGTLLASSTLQTGTTAGVLAQADFATPYVVPADGIYWATYYISANLNIRGCTGQGGFHTTGSTFPFASPAPSNSNAATRSVVCY